ncbi:TetR/AcrR family transcriptional regulator [Guggenheimella bovis]
MKEYFTPRFYALPEKKQELIIDRAIDAFAKKGFYATSMTDIAKATQTSIGSLYNYCTSKEDLFCALFKATFVGMGERLEKALPDEMPFKEKLEASFSIAFDNIVNNPSLIQIYNSLRTESNPGLAEELVIITEGEWFPFIKRMVQTAIDKGEIRSDINIEGYSLFIDILITSYQAMQTSDFLKAKLRLFFHSIDEDSDLRQLCLDAIYRYGGVQ